MTAVRRGALALGSNVGDRAAELIGAVRDLASVPGLHLVAASSVYETRAVGGPVQDSYLNAVVVIETALSARAVLDAALVVEAAHGRVRAERWGPRTLDIDILVLGEETSDDPLLTLPHPRAHERAFVLVPWSEVDPDAAIPRWGTVLELLGELPSADLADVHLVSGLELPVGRS
jgi:2-amino-4-hydroxy-6-hydroxymethyldihydropteridine diphosphokinase